MKMYISILFFSILFFDQLWSQEEDLIQFSGYTIMGDADSLTPCAFVIIKNKSRNSGAYSDPNGFFTLVVKRGDTIQFSSIGFQKNTLIIPFNIKSDRFTANQRMIRETQKLPETVIVPWRNLDELKQAVLELKVDENDLILAYQNLQYDRWASLQQSMPLDGVESQRRTLIQQNSENRTYNLGITPVNNILNPLAWYQFINQLSNNKKKKAASISDDKYEK
jgi:hypothetical protein